MVLKLFFNTGNVAKSRARKPNIKSKEIISSDSEDESDSVSNVSEKDPLDTSQNYISPVKKRITRINTLLKNSPEIQTAKKQDPIVTVDVIPSYEIQRQKNIEDRNTFLKTTTKEKHSNQKRKSKTNSEDSPIPPAKKSKPIIPVKKRIMPKRGAQKSKMSYSENYVENVEEDPFENVEENHSENSVENVEKDTSEKSFALPPALLAANPGLANATSGKNSIFILIFI